MKLTSLILSCLTFVMLSSSLPTYAATVPSTHSPLAQTSGTAPSVTPETTINKININQATANEIQAALVGIGAKKAEAIVEYREAQGPFTMLEQLLEIPGIGPATLEKNKARITL
ncbi:hypothetical protein I926_07275 [Pasteurella multocida subsp. multocida OH4807]|nr:hypothetical protein I926_07275 [Pasteurella multocida subsp. multocida OH4807]